MGLLHCSPLFPTHVLCAWSVDSMGEPLPSGNQEAGQAGGTDAS